MTADQKTCLFADNTMVIGLIQDGDESAYRRDRLKTMEVTVDFTRSPPTHHQEVPAEDVLPVPAQEVPPASGAADPRLLCNHPLCLVWSGHQKGQETGHNGHHVCVNE